MYRAHDERLDRDVAIKVLPSGALADEPARRRFRKEALTLSKLNHPHIATVFDFDAQDGVDFIVMELIEGMSLAEKLKTGALPEKEIGGLGGQIADALEEAHERGVVHRDLKPGNIALTPKGRVKVLDFGLARMLRPVSDEASTEALTETHAVAGTLPYMSPEELRGERADHRSDIYSFGVVLYEMATGRRPFEEKLSTRLTDAILHQVPEPPSTHNRKISRGLEGVILKALDKDPGYRYQSVREMGVDLERLAAPVPLVAPKRRAVPLVWMGLAGAAAVVAVGVAVAFLLMSGGKAPEIRSIAVLPLANLSSDPEQEFFADGMTEALITDLAKIGALKIISRSSTMRFKDTNEPLPEIARLLNVDAVVEGSVLRAGDRVRITAQLIHAGTDQHLWAESYERDLRDVLQLQSEVARAIASEIQLTLTPEEETRLADARPVDPEAHVAYLKGRYHWDKRTKKDLEIGLRYFQEAIEKDPSYAAAYAGLADSYNMLSEAGYGDIPREEASSKAKAAAEKALELDGNLAEAHAALGYALGQEGDRLGAEEEYKRAIELNPSYATAHNYYSTHLCARGKLGEAIDEVKRALELDPLSIIINVNLTRFLYLARRYNEAFGQARKTLEIDPNSWLAHFWLGTLHEQKSEVNEAVAAFEQAADLFPNGTTLSSLAHAYGISGREDEARRLLNRLQDQARKGLVSGLDLSVAYIGLGEHEIAIDCLENDLPKGGGMLLSILRFDPVFDPLRDDTRFQEILRRLNVPE